MLGRFRRDKPILDPAIPVIPVDNNRVTDTGSVRRISHFSELGNHRLRGSLMDIFRHGICRDQGWLTGVAESYNAHRSPDPFIPNPMNSSSGSETLLTGMNLSMSE